MLPVVALGVTVLTFALMRLMPGDPAALIARAKYGEEVRPDLIEQVRKDEGLDAPLPFQYLRWLARVARGDLGLSVASRQPVIGEIAARLPATFRLALAALLFSALVGIPLGVICAARKGKTADAVGTFGALVGVSVPSFWLALLLILVFNLRLGWLPSYGDEGPSHLVLPTLTLGLGMAALVTRVTRTSMLEALGQEYIRTARAKGLSERAVLLRHALKNALIPVVTILGLQFGRLLEGAVIVETIFGWPGIGRLLVNSIFERDFPVVQGCVLTIAAVVVALNLAVDLLYAWLDPRIRYAKGR